MGLARVVVATCAVAMVVVVVVMFAMARVGVRVVSHWKLFVDREC